MGAIRYLAISAMETLLNPLISCLRCGPIANDHSLKVKQIQLNNSYGRMGGGVLRVGAFF
jgi:hypothetical protein